jgi:hypothetical protein
MSIDNIRISTEQALRLDRRSGLWLTLAPARPAAPKRAIHHPPSPENESNPAVSNRNKKRLEILATYTKQTSEVLSNRDENAPFFGALFALSLARRLSLVADRWPCHSSLFSPFCYNGL